MRGIQGAGRALVGCDCLLTNRVLGRYIHFFFLPLLFSIA